MSQKTAKAIRKLAKKELQNMQPNQPQQQPRPINIIAELEQFVVSCELLTGEKPASIVLTDTMYTLYVQTAQRHAESLGLNQGFKTEEPTFMGVKLVKKSPLIMPEQPQIVTPETK